jgi:hypothetical protein
VRGLPQPKQCGRQQDDEREEHDDEAVPGPPCVIAKMMSKLLTASIMRIMPAMNRNGAISGNEM